MPPPSYNFNQPPTGSDHLNYDHLNYQQGMAGPSHPYPTEADWENPDSQVNNPLRPSPGGTPYYHLGSAAYEGERFQNPGPRPQVFYFPTLSESGLTEHTLPPQSEEGSVVNVESTHGGPVRNQRTLTVPTPNPRSKPEEEPLYNEVAAYFLATRLRSEGGAFPSTKRNPSINLTTEAATAYAGFVHDSGKGHPQTNRSLLAKVAVASGQVFRTNISKASFDTFHTHYLQLAIPPGSTADPVDRPGRLQLALNLIALRTDLNYLHFPSPDPTEPQFFNHPFFFQSLSQHIWSDKLFGTTIPDQYDGVPWSPHTMGLWGCSIAHHIDVKIAQLIGSPVPKFDDAYHVEAGHIATQVSAYLADRVHGPAFLARLTKWATRTEVRPPRSVPVPLVVPPGPQMPNFGAPPVPIATWNVFVGTPAYPVIPGATIVPPERPGKGKRLGD